MFQTRAAFYSVDTVTPGASVSTVLVRLAHVTRHVDGRAWWGVPAEVQVNAGVGGHKRAGTYIRYRNTMRHQLSTDPAPAYAVLFKLWIQLSPLSFLTTNAAAAQ
jgi:hypothetical protein